jgi:hypothetical protein
MAPASTAKKQHESAVFLNAVDPTGIGVSSLIRFAHKWLLPGLAGKKFLNFSGSAFQFQSVI